MMHAGLVQALKARCEKHLHLVWRELALRFIRASVNYWCQTMPREALGAVSLASDIGVINLMLFRLFNLEIPM